jgi:hypothetical protein
VILFTCAVLLAVAYWRLLHAMADATPPPPRDPVASLVQEYVTTGMATEELERRLDERFGIRGAPGPIIDWMDV